METSCLLHPCARLVYHEDLQKEIGIIRLKPQKGSTEPRYCAFIEGATADSAGYCKIDLLKVDVVTIINDTFKAIGKPVMTAAELSQYVEDHPEVWNLYDNGFTMGLNQTEKAATTQKVMQFKPRNTVELSAFVASIRPGAKSLVGDFVARKFHNYNIPAMDNLLKLNGATGVTGESSFLFYDEQVMVLAEAAGITPEDAVLLIKAIKKKKLDKVKHYEEEFIPGFIKYLKEKENVEDELANKTAHDVWTVILNSASYLFNASHAYAMCLDSLYGAVLKTIAPYEFYLTMLKLYTEKGNKEKIALIIDEMKRYKGINLTAGTFGQDNRDWYCDKENKTISQSISSIKFISKKCAEELYKAGQKEFNTFTDLLRYLQMETCVDVRQIGVLIGVGYFKKFGGNKKLYNIMNEFIEGKNKLTKTIKSYEKRLEAMREYEASCEDGNISIGQQLILENENIGLCISSFPDTNNNTYFVLDVDDKYGIKVKLYNVKRGTSGIVRMKKDTYANNKIEQNQCIVIRDGGTMPKYTYQNGKRIPSATEKEYWIRKFDIVA